MVARIFRVEADLKKLLDRKENDKEVLRQALKNAREVGLTHAISDVVRAVQDRLFHSSAVLTSDVSSTLPASEFPVLMARRLIEQLLADACKTNPCAVLTCMQRMQYMSRSPRQLLLQLLTKVVR